MRQRVLPNQIFFWHFRSDVARFWPHITVRQFKPRTGKRFVERLWIVQETAGDLLEFRIETQRQVGNQHCWLTFFRRIKRIGDNFWRINRFKLNRACRTASLHPLIFEQVLEEIVAPLGRRLRPDHFQTGSNCVCARAAAVAAGPAQALRFNRRGFWIGTYVRSRCCTVGFAQRMTAANQRHGFFVVHAHVTEGRANRRCRRKRFAAMVRPFRVYIDKTHFGRAQRRFRQLFRMTVGQPGFFITPVYVEIRFPDIFTTGTKAEGTEAGVFQRHVARKDKQVGPGNFLTIFLLDWPQQTTRFIQADVVRPGVQWCKTLLSATRATASIDGTIGPCTVPCHADK